MLSNRRPDDREYLYECYFCGEQRGNEIWGYWVKDRESHFKQQPSGIWICQTLWMARELNVTFPPEIIERG